MAVWRKRSLQDASQSACESSPSLSHTGAVSSPTAPVPRAVKLLGQREDIGLERELHKIYRMFLDGQTNLLRLKGSLQRTMYTSRCDGIYEGLRTKVV